MPKKDNGEKEPKCCSPEKSFNPDATVAEKTEFTFRRADSHDRFFNDRQQIKDKHKIYAVPV